MKDSNGHEISDDVQDLIDRRNRLAELYNCVHDQSNKYLIGERIRKLDAELFEVYGII